MSLSLDDPEAQEYLDMVTSINNFKVLVSSNQSISDDIKMGQAASFNKIWMS